MRWVQDSYSAVSGQKINYEKSLICFSFNVMQQSRDEVVGSLGVCEGDTFGKYQGSPSLVGRKRKVILAFIKDKILTRVRSWNAKFLSRADREVLLKTVIKAMPSYAMMVFLLPIGICRDIETIMNEYWWTGTAGNGKGIKWKTWGVLAQNSWWNGI